MLASSDKEKLTEYIDKMINSISSDAKCNIQNKLSDRQVLDKVINVTVNRLTLESKTLLSSTYNMMVDRTLAKPLYQDAHNKAAFYEMNILRELNSKFTFDIPENIDYEEIEKEINKWVKIGAVVVSGGIISISLGSYIPIGISVIIAGIMSPLLKDRIENGNTNIDSLIDKYLNKVKQSLWSWIDSIVEYYDDRIRELERRLVR